MAFTLTSVAQREKKWTFTNLAYVSTKEAQALPQGANKVNYILLGGSATVASAGVVYTAMPVASGVKVGEIGLNALQRSCLRISAGASISVAPFPIPTLSTFQLVSATFEVEALGKRRATIKEDDLMDHVRKVYANQVLTRNQEICIDLKGVPLALTVKALSVARESSGAEAKSRGTLTTSSHRGLLVQATAIEADVHKSNRVLTFEKSAKSRNSPMFKPSWRFEDMGIGGLNAEFSDIFRRAFASRLFPPDVIGQLGIKHVKGMLLYGPPGTGKTLIAKQIGKMLATRPPKVVNGPEILNKFVGASEENIRKLFLDAEEDYKKNAERADLHIIIFDEIDAICKARGTASGSTGVHDTVVNQLLSKIDGVDSPNNILVIGMTNRKDMIDPALLRPGRLEVHVEIGLPDEEGRLQILGIHTKKMKDSGRLSDDVQLEELAANTKNFSGAEIEGLVKNASSYALYGGIDVTKEQVLARPDVTDLKVGMEHFTRALDEAEPAFGVAEDELKLLVRGDLVNYSSVFTKIMQTGQTLIRQVRNSESTPLLSMLLQGAVGTGKTAIAAQLAINSDFPYVKLISPEMFVSGGERDKCHKIHKIFEDAYKSPLSLIVLDSIERLLEYVPIGPRFSNHVLQTLLVLLRKLPPYEGRRLMVIATTSSPSVVEDMEMAQAFNVVIDVPQLQRADDVRAVIESVPGSAGDADAGKLAAVSPLPIGVKPLLMVLEMSRQGVNGRESVTVARFKQCLEDSGLLGEKKKKRIF